MSTRGLAIFGAVLAIMAFLCFATPFGDGYVKGVRESEECQEPNKRFPGNVYCAIFGAGGK